MALTKVTKTGITDNAIDADKLEDGTVLSADIAPGTIANAKLANSSITVNGSSVSLGGSVTAKHIDWQSVITADGSTTTTAVAGQGYFIDTTSAAHTINLPASPSAGDTVAIKDYAGTFGTNALTIGRNSENIQGIASDSQISTNRASVVLVYIDATKGWLYTNESNVADLQAPFYISATGGTETTDGDFKIHSFTGDGCFVVSSLGGGGAPCVQASTVDYLVVAGGGGAGKIQAGGGGAGGYREGKDSTLSSPHTASPLAATSGLTITATTYPITVGAGGAGMPVGPIPSGTGTPGSNSIFSTITSTGGGGGGFGANGASGGSGGGGGEDKAAGSGNTPPTSPPQGNNGGIGNPPTISGGGGGGAGAVGSTSSASGGPGGNGVASSITGSSVTRAGGGGGGGGPAGGGSGGSGGGGPGKSNGGTPGTANTGGGGGSNCFPVVPGTFSGSGGKGIVVIRYKYQ